MGGARYPILHWAGCLGPHLRLKGYPLRLSFQAPPMPQSVILSCLMSLSYSLPTALTGFALVSAQLVPVQFHSHYLDDCVSALFSAGHSHCNSIERLAVDLNCLP